MINIPTKIDKTLRTRILAAYEEAIDDLDSEELLYIQAKLPRVIKRLKTRPAEWPSPLADVATALVQAFKHPSNNQNVKTELSRRILAALFYLCDPFDIVPDHTPGEGYVDDALVLNECVEYIRKQHPEIYETVMPNL
jgi:uncharacterized membrane protein YkvA (DUF1232 family)